MNVVRAENAPPKIIVCTPTALFYLLLFRCNNTKQCLCKGMLQSDFCSQTASMAGHTFMYHL